MTTRRIIISIPDDDKLWLEGYSKVHKISVAEAIRQGISQLKKEQRRQTYQQLVESTTGIWKKGDGLAYQEKLRTEWE
jgi:Mor family transcriptional regulator